MNKKLIFTTLLFWYISFTFAQVKDTIFYNRNWKEISNKLDAYYYRPLPLETQNNLFVIKDYYMNDNLQMHALSKNKSGELFEKKATWFYNNGNKKIEKYYDHKNTISKENSFFYDGTAMASAKYVNGECFDGTCYGGYYNSNKYEFKTTTYKKGKYLSVNAYYEKSKTIAIKDNTYFNEKGDTLFTTGYANNKTLEVCYSLSNNNNIDDIVYAIHQEVQGNEVKRIITDKNGNIIGEGIYKHNSPFNGKFLENKTLFTYKNGIKEGDIVFFDRNYKKIAKGIYKNNKPFSGSFYDYSSREIKKLKKGFLIGKQSKNRYTNAIYDCKFENNIPIEGDYFNEKNTLISYKNKLIVNKIEYQYPGEILTSIEYKKGKPFEGMLIEKHKNNKGYDYNREAKKYAQGNLEISYSKPNKFSLLNTPIDYTYKTFHTSLKDSIITGKSALYKLSKIIINYNSELKTRGNVAYFYNNELIGNGKFNKNKITSLKFKFQLDGASMSIKLKDNKLSYNIIKDDYRGEFISSNINIYEESHNVFFQNLISIIESRNDSDNFYLYVDSDEPLSIVEMKEGKFYQGVFFTLRQNELYDVIIFKKGYHIENIKGLTKKQLFDRMEEFKLKI